jgi:anaerobic magnesium-protoporphyrin IX monomethyl ester cyclase
MSVVLFGQSYYLRFDPKLWQAMQPYPPLGTLYAAAYLRTRGYRVALFDAMLAESEAEWEAALRRHRPRFAVIYEDNFNYLSKMCLLRMRQAAFTMIAMAKAQGCTVIVAGSDATDHAEAYLRQGADFVLLGEGEYTLAELLDRLSGRADTPFAAILGLAYRGEDGTPVRNPRRPDIKDVDGLPFPAWDLVDLERYRRIWYGRHGYYSMNMVTTRGCPYHCNWCAKPIWGQRYNARSPENVVAELKWLKETYHPDHIWFADDIFGLKPGWIERFSQRVQEAKAVIPFKCLLRVDLVNPRVVAALKAAGCKTVWVGAESGAQKILDAMEKGTRVEQIYEATRLLHAAGIEVGFFLQFGYPGETRADIEKTLQMVRDCRPDDIGMSVSYPLPGTKFYERVKDQLGVQQNWLDSNDLAMLYRGPYTTAFYRQLHTVLHKEFRMRKYWAELKHLARHPRGFQKKHLRYTGAMVYHAVTLPWERHRLNQLEKQPQMGLRPLPPGLSPEAAATPTPQPET